MTSSIAPAGLVAAGAVPRPEQVDAAWIEALLLDAGYRVAIEALSVERIGTGQLGDTARFRLRYTPGGDPAPATLIGKFSSTDPTSLEVAAAWSLYAREVRFYRELAARARIAIPACYGARMDEAGGFALLLEDLAPAAPGDQFRGLSDGNAKRAVREAARLHAAFWEQGENADLAWLDTAASGQPFYTADVFRGAWPGFRDRYDAMLSDDQRRVCDALAEGYDVYDRPRPRPRCITHNDFRPDNMLFDDDRLVVVDWQSVALGCGAVDVAYLIGGGYTPEARRAVEPALIAAYLDELQIQGVRDYSPAEFEDDYRHFTFAGINVAVGAAMLVQRTERGDRMFLTMLDRHVSHVLDHDALALLRE
ncbi:phosphotransferase family protein [Sphingopyxis sp. KK2]|uniref:phosphotransferase family protein n=1 Tax=Sphingopyxis sp. KK2 TaxID=1855727 RepID=UPI0015C39A67|nr:phosphotransferase [Sphingopyxis sp. KK2]